MQQITQLHDRAEKAFMLQVTLDPMVLEHVVTITADDELGGPRERDGLPGRTAIVTIHCFVGVCHWSELSAIWTHISERSNITF